MNYSYFLELFFLNKTFSAKTITKDSDLLLFLIEKNGSRSGYKI